MTISIALQFVVVLAAIWMGARSSGVGLGLWGAVGLADPRRRLRRESHLAPRRRHADHPGGHHGRLGDGGRRRHRLPRAHRRARHPGQSEVRHDRGPAHHLDLPVRGGHRPHRLSAAPRDLRDRAPERHPARAAHGGRDHRLAAGDHREPRGRGDGRDDRALRREGPHPVGTAPDPDGLRAGHA